MSSLDDLRRRINELDRQILELVGKRQETSREVARAKRATGQATRDYNREKEVLLAAREAGRECGVPPQLAENILRLLIRSSLTTQEQASVAAQGAGTGRSALVIGGAGKMGRWFAEFMSGIERGIVRAPIPMYARERLVLGGKARVNGNVYYGVIEMAPGAVITGKLIPLTKAAGSNGAEPPAEAPAVAAAKSGA